MYCVRRRGCTERSLASSILNLCAAWCAGAEAEFDLCHQAFDCFFWCQHAQVSFLSISFSTYAWSVVQLPSFLSLFSLSIIQMPQILSSSFMYFFLHLCLCVFSSYPDLSLQCFQMAVSVERVRIERVIDLSSAISCPIHSLPLFLVHACVCMLLLFSWLASLSSHLSICLHLCLGVFFSYHDPSLLCFQLALDLLLTLPTNEIQVSVLEENEKSIEAKRMRRERSSLPNVLSLALSSLLVDGTVVVKCYLSVLAHPSCSCSCSDPFLSWLFSCSFNTVSCSVVKSCYFSILFLFLFLFLFPFLSLFLLLIMTMILFLFLSF